MIQNVEKLLFTRELSVLLKSGVPLREALVSIAEQSQFSSMRRVIETVIEDIENGQPLAYALERHPKVFSHLFVSLVGIGERSGALSKNLEFLALQLEKTYQLKKKIQSVLLYPAIVLATSVTLTGLISVFVLPKLMKLFASFDMLLPLSTRILLAFSLLMKEYGVIALLMIGILAVVFRGVTLLPIIRPYWHRVLLRLPVVGAFLRSLYLAQFFRDMGVMLGSGLSISQALLVEERAAQNWVFADMARGLHTSSLEGRTLSAELSGRYASLAPSVVTKMIFAGEQSGRLSETFLYLGDFLDEEVDRNAKNFTVVLEPALLIIIASVVIFLALAILSPIYQLTGSVHR
ncbi:MAG: type II secretion system F family protein [Candidatus Moranbacteria bacterium]|nr:type II secretion system F family protein [Candidatus Moranbacteria bacterium]